MNKIYIPNSALFSYPGPSRTFSKLSFHTRGHQVYVRINFVQEEPLDLQCLTMIWAICVAEDVSINLDIPTLGILSNFWSILHLYLSTSGYCISCLSWTSWKPWYNVHYFCCSHLRRRRELLWILHSLQSRLLQCHLGERLVLYTSEIVVLNSAFFEMTDVRQCGKVDFFCVFLCLQNYLLFCSSLCPTAKLESFRVSSIPCPLLPSHPELKE